MVLSVSAEMVPRYEAAPLLLDWLTVGDLLAPAVDSVVVTPRKTVEPRFYQRKNVEIDALTATTQLRPPLGTAIIRLLLRLLLGFLC